MSGAVEWGERHQIPLLVAAILAGATLGLAVPAWAPPLELAITPVLGLLLYATFLGVPFAAIARAVTDRRFLGSVLLLNFVLVPVAVFGLSRFVAGEPALLIGVLLVLLAPCVDYVIVFSGLAGGARDRLLAATPVLMLGQMVLLPVYVWLMAGGEIVAALDARPFLDAFLLLIVFPLAAAALTQVLATKSAAGRGIARAATGALVPLMMITLAVVVASQVSRVAGAWGALLAVVPLFVAFVPIAVMLGMLTGRLLRLDVPERRAVVFSGVTRNSLVVLPLALALPASFARAPLVIVTQTLIELVAMVVLVAVVPRIVGPTEARRGK